VPWLAESSFYIWWGFTVTFKFIWWQNGISFFAFCFCVPNNNSLGWAMRWHKERKVGVFERNISYTWVGGKEAFSRETERCCKLSLTKTLSCTKDVSGKFWRVNKHKQASKVFTKPAHKALQREQEGVRGREICLKSCKFNCYTVI